MLYIFNVGRGWVFGGMHGLSCLDLGCGNLVGWDDVQAGRSGDDTEQGTGADMIDSGYLLFLLRLCNKGEIFGPSLQNATT